MRVRILLLAATMAAASAAEAQPVKAGVEPSALGAGYEAPGVSNRRPRPAIARRWFRSMSSSRADA